MTLLTACCCGGCQTPTGPRTIQATRHVEVSLPTAPFTGTSTVEWYAEFYLVFSGTSLNTTTSYIRVRYDRNIATTFPDGTPWQTQQYKLDVTMELAGGFMDCNGSGSNVCGTCGDPPSHRYDPQITLPYKVGSNQVGGLTVNSYVNTSTQPWVGVGIQSTEVTLGTPTTSLFCTFPILNTYAYNGTSWQIQPSSASDAQARPLRVYSAVGASGPTSVCPPIDQVLGQGFITQTGFTKFGATAYGSAGLFPDRCVQNLCDEGKGYLVNNKGWNFTTDTATASMT